MSVLCFNSLRYPFPCLILSDLASPGERKTTTPPTYLCEVTGINREPWDGHTLAGLCMLFNSYCNKPLAHPKTSSWCGTAFFWAMSRLWNVPSVSASERQRVDIMFVCVRVSVTVTTRQSYTTYPLTVTYLVMTRLATLKAQECRSDQGQPLETENVSPHFFSKSWDQESKRPVV